MRANDSIPELLKPLLNTYITALQRELPGMVEGVYLHGSIALHSFNDSLSDVDFITVVSRRCTAQDIQKLVEIHQQIENAYPRWPLQGSYLQWHDLGQFAESIEPAPYYTDGILYPAGHHDINAVTWWLLKNKGIALVGPNSHTLNFSVDWDVVVDKMHQNMNEYWATFTRSPSRMVWFFGDYGVQWTVLGVLRQYYTFREHDITSKIGAGEYALKHVPQKWQRIIQEAINIRNRTPDSLYRSRINRAVDAFRFMKFIIRNSTAP